MTELGRDRSARRRLGLITVDQAIAGASNVLISVLAARFLPVAAFGLFGIVFLVYVLAQGVCRALVCDPLLVHPVEGEQRRGEVIGTSALLGVGLGGIVALCGLLARVWSGQLGTALLILGACMPLLALQDLGRYLGFARQRPSSSVALDTWWLVLLFGALAGLAATGRHSLSWFILAWAGSGALAGLLTLGQHRDSRLRLGLAWLRYTWSFSWRYLISYASTQGTALAGSSAVGGIAGARALAGVNGAALLVRPFATVQVAAIAAAVPEMTRSVGELPRIRRQAHRISLLTAVAAFVNGAVALALPDAIGRQVLGATWPAARPLLLATSVQILFLGAMTGLRAGLLGLRAIRKAMAIDIASTVLVLAASVVGALLDGARGAVWAVAGVQGLLTGAWLLTFQHATHPRFRHVGRHRRSAPAAPPVGEPAQLLGEPAPVLAGRPSPS